MIRLLRSGTLLALPLLLATPAYAQDAVDGDELASEEEGEPIHTIPAAVGEDARAAIAGVNRFSIELFQRTVKPTENHFISPASVSTAVGLAYRGAAGPTASELDTVFHFGRSPREYLGPNAQVLATMEFEGPSRELHTANALWLQEGMPLVPDYERDVAELAGAGLNRIDFRRAHDAARLDINQWVARTTRDRIKDLLLPDDVSKETRAILVNAIYWKGGWANPFRPSATREERFTPLRGDPAPIPLMNVQDSFQSVERDGIKAILLPYVGGEVDMAVFLPRSAKGLPQFEAGLDADQLSRWLHDLDEAEARETILTLPKMRLEWRDDLVPALKSMGVTTAFSEDADFSGMASIPYPGEVDGAVGLNFSKVIHKTFLDVDEKGSEAAAATAVVMAIVVTGLSGPRPEPFVFRADKPFFFLLRDRRTGLILFLGRFVSPAASAG